MFHVKNRLVNKENVLELFLQDSKFSRDTKQRN